MDKRIIGVFVFAGLVALITSGAVYKLLAGRLASASASGPTVFVAARDLALGVPLSKDDLRPEQWRSPLPKTAIQSEEQLLDRPVLQPMVEGELFTEARLGPKGGGAGLAAKIPNGMRAIAVKVNDVIGVAGFVLPGMRVDVIALGEKPGQHRSSDLYGIRSRTLLQNVEVLSAGQNIETDPNGKPAPVQVVNLLVNPEQAEMLSLVVTEAKLQLLLRNPLDTAQVATPGTAEGIVFGEMPGRLPGARTQRVSARPATPAPPPPPAMETVVVPVTMEILNGAKRQDVKVGETTEERPVEGGRKK
ncbi:MAG TPA: Flp pilus assembly protein CpaB [Bryobacteraceae bacterium]|nr:Flp pilus assembly protein CpaB [Bryobacteraceae bacterium]